MGFVIKGMLCSVPRPHTQLGHVDRWCKLAAVGEALELLAPGLQWS